MIIRSREEWEQYRTEYNQGEGIRAGPYSEIPSTCYPDQYPCFAKRSYYWDNPNGRDEQLYEFFYLDEASELYGSLDNTSNKDGPHVEG
jgi:hypothetical protein